MMEKRNLPFRLVLFDLGHEPIDLLFIQIDGVKRVERDLALLETVVFLTVHVEVLVIDLIRLIVDPQRAVELDLAIEQSLVRKLKILYIKQFGKLVKILINMAEQKTKTGG